MGVHPSPDFLCVLRLRLRPAQLRFFGTVRVNGGLVVPGRFYQIHQIIEITSDVPVNIPVRPLGVVTEYHDVPVIPRANG